MPHVGDASKNGIHLCALLQDAMKNKRILGINQNNTHDATSNNEPTTALAMDILTNYAGSIWCTVYTVSAAVNSVFKAGTVWQVILNIINRVISFAKQHSKEFVQKL